ncbi:peptidogalycan biosysnthesis protein, partial [Paraburkholderia sp. BR10879]|uniref:peptidogalycan biosysnthesis protein n=1 Tax=Paraburkholderia sp. BR10879 TaxID=3236990 RepID=UPI00397CDA37
QGEHKMARGFLPTATRSAHWLAHPAFSDAVARFLESETNHGIVLEAMIVMGVGVSGHVVRKFYG